MKHSLIRTVSETAPEAAFSGCSHAPAPAARRDKGAPPIFVDGEPIAEGAIAAEAQNHSANSAAEARAAAARALVIRHLLLRRAHELGLAPDRACDDQGREETSEEALVRQVLQLEAPGDEPSEAECRRVYEGSKERFTVPVLFEASHILFQPAASDSAAWAEAHRRAQEAIESLKRGADFAQLARQHSACSSAADGGALGQLQRGDLAPAFEDPLLCLKPGQISAIPVKTSHGWHVLRLDRYAPAHALPFEAVAERIAAALRTRSAIAASARYVEKLAARARIEGLSLMSGAAS